MRAAGASYRLRLRNAVLMMNSRHAAIRSWGMWEMMVIQRWSHVMHAATAAIGGRNRNAPAGYP